VTAELRELLALYVLAALEPAEAQQVERAAAADPEVAAELAAYRQTADELVASPSPVAPSPEVHARLMASVGGGRFERFASRLASMYDVTVDRARELLGLIERPASWQVGVPGMALVHFAGGPAAAHADNGFVRLDPGATFPWHAHRGKEIVIVLAGALRDHNGREQHAGDVFEMDADSAHEVVGIGDEPCIYAASVMGGLDIQPKPT
jgi:putative transcriptional regulator